MSDNEKVQYVISQYEKEIDEYILSGGIERFKTLVEKLTTEVLLQENYALLHFTHTKKFRQFLLGAVDIYFIYEEDDQPSEMLSIITFIKIYNMRTKMLYIHKIYKRTISNICSLIKLENSIPIPKQKKVFQLLNILSKWNQFDNYQNYLLLPGGESQKLECSFQADSDIGLSLNRSLHYIIYYQTQQNQNGHLIKIESINKQNYHSIAIRNDQILFQYQSQQYESNSRNEIVIFENSMCNYDKVNCLFFKADVSSDGLYMLLFFQLNGSIIAKQIPLVDICLKSSSYTLQVFSNLAGQLNFFAVGGHMLTDDNIKTITKSDSLSHNGSQQSQKKVIEILTQHKLNTSIYVMLPSFIQRRRRIDTNALLNICPCQLNVTINESPIIVDQSICHFYNRITKSQYLNFVALLQNVCNECFSFEQISELYNKLIINEFLYQHHRQEYNQIIKQYIGGMVVMQKKDNMTKIILSNIMKAINTTLGDQQMILYRYILLNPIIWSFLARQEEEVDFLQQSVFSNMKNIHQNNTIKITNQFIKIFVLITQLDKSELNIYKQKSILIILLQAIKEQPVLITPQFYFKIVSQLSSHKSIDVIYDLLLDILNFSVRYLSIEKSFIRQMNNHLVSFLFNGENHQYFHNCFMIAKRFDLRHFQKTFCSQIRLKYYQITQGDDLTQCLDKIIKFIQDNKEGLSSQSVDRLVQQILEGSCLAGPVNGYSFICAQMLIEIIPLSSPDIQQLLIVNLYQVSSHFSIIQLIRLSIILFLKIQQSSFPVVIQFLSKEMTDSFLHSGHFNHFTFLVYLLNNIKCDNFPAGLAHKIIENILQTILIEKKNELNVAQLQQFLSLLCYLYCSQIKIDQFNATIILLSFIQTLSQLLDQILNYQNISMFFKTFKGSKQTTENDQSFLQKSLIMLGVQKQQNTSTQTKYENTFMNLILALLFDIYQHYQLDQQYQQEMHFLQDIIKKIIYKLISIYDSENYKNKTRSQKVLFKWIYNLLYFVSQSDTNYNIKIFSFIMPIISTNAHLKTSFANDLIINLSKASNVNIDNDNNQELLTNIIHYLQNFILPSFDDQLFQLRQDFLLQLYGIAIDTIRVLYKKECDENKDNYEKSINKYTIFKNQNYVYHSQFIDRICVAFLCKLKKKINIFYKRVKVHYRYHGPMFDNSVNLGHQGEFFNIKNYPPLNSKNVLFEQFQIPLSDGRRPFIKIKNLFKFLNDNQNTLLQQLRITLQQLQNYFLKNKMTFYQIAQIKLQGLLPAFLTIHEQKINIWYVKLNDLEIQQWQYKYLNCLDQEAYHNIKQSIQYKTIIFIDFYSFLHQQKGIRIIRGDGKEFIFDFQTQKKCFSFMANLQKQIPYEKQQIINSSINRKQNLSKMTNKWAKGKISTMKYLNILNMASQRSVADLSKYPIFPLTIMDTSSLKLRQLPLPVGMQTNDKKIALYTLNFDPAAPLSQQFFYPLLYSSPSIVYQLNCRLGNFGAAQSTFSDQSIQPFLSLRQMEENIYNDLQDVRELTPEFYYLPELFINLNSFDFGNDENDQIINNFDIDFHQAYQDPYKMVYFMRKLLESEQIAQNINYWFELIFGYKQGGKAAQDNHNIFPGICDKKYCFVNIEPETENHKQQLQQIYFKGQLPEELFTYPHPKKNFIDQHVNWLHEKINNIIVHSSTLNEEPIKQSKILLFQKLKSNSHTNTKKQTIQLVILNQCKIKFWSIVHSENDINGKTNVEYVIDQEFEINKYLQQLYNYGFDRTPQKNIAILGQYVICHGGLIDGNIFITDLVNMEIQQKLNFHLSTVTILKLITKNKIVAADQDGIISLWDITKNIKNVKFQSSNHNYYGTIIHDIRSGGKEKNFFIILFNKTIEVISMVNFSTVLQKIDINSFTFTNNLSLQQYGMIFFFYSSGYVPCMIICIQAQSKFIISSLNFRGEIISQYTIMKKFIDQVIQCRIITDELYHDYLLCLDQIGGIYILDIPFFQKEKIFNIDSDKIFHFFDVAYQNKFIIACDDMGSIFTIEPSFDN